MDPTPPEFPAQGIVAPPAKSARHDWGRTRSLLVVAALAGLADVLIGFASVSARVELAVHDLLQLVAAAAAAWACLAVAPRHDGRWRVGWRLLGLGAACWAVGQVIWTWYEVVRNVPVPFPGPDDVAYLAMYPLAIVGVLLLSPLSTKGGLMRAGITLDALLSTLAVVVIAWPLFLHQALHEAPSLAVGWLTVAYPLLDLVLLSLAGGLLFRARDAWPSSLGLAYAAFALILFADLGYAVQVFQDSYVTGQVLDAGWIMGFLFLAAAAYAPPAQVVDPSTKRYARVVGHVLPFAAIVVGGAGFLLGQATATHPWEMQVLLASLVVVALARQALAAWEYRVIFREREAAQADYRALFDNMREGLANCRMIYEDGQPVDFEYLSVNRNFEALTGLRDVAGRRVSQLIPGIRASNPGLFASYARAAAGGSPEHFEVEVPGVKRWFAITSYPSRPGEFTVVFENITERKEAEQRLGFQAHLLDSVGQAVVATDASGVITYWGPGAVALYGWEATQAIGRPIFDVVPSEASEAQAAGIRANLTAGKPWTGEFVVRRKDGSPFTALVNSNPVLDDDGRLVAMIGVSQDISAMKRLELDLRERVKELQALSAVATAGAKDSDLQTLLQGTVRALETAFLHDDAWVLARAGGLEATSEGPQPEGPELRSKFQSVNGEGAIAVRYRGPHEDHDAGPFLREEQTLLDSLGDLLTTVLGKKIAAERVRFQAHLLQNVSQAVVATDLEGRVTYWSPSAERLFGWPHAEAVGQPVVDLWGDVLVVSPRQDPNEESPSGDYPMRRKDGSPVLVSMSTSPLLSPVGALEGFIAVAQDATQARAQAIALQRRERALTLISAVNEALIRSDSEPRLLQEVCDIAVEKGGYRMAWVGFARDTPGHPVEPVAWAGQASGYLKTVNVTWDNLPRGQVTGKSIREGRTVAMRDMLRDPAYAPWREKALAQGYASSISLFLPLGDERGALMLYSTQPNAFEADEVALLEEMAGDLAFGIRTLRLRAKETSLTTMLNDAQELSKIGAWDFNAATGKVTWTREVYRIHEVPESFDPSDAGRDIAFYEGEDQARIDAAFRAAVQHGKPYDLELRLTTAKGRQLNVRTVGLPEMKDGKVVRVRGNIMDITEQKRAQEAVLVSEARLREAQRVGKIGAWELDLQQNVLWWSEENYRVFGVEPGGFGATYDFFLETIHPDDREAVRRAYDSSVANRTPYGIEHRLVMKDGSVKWVYERCETFYDPDGKPLKSVGTTQDITERKAAEEARRAVEAKDLEVKRLEQLNRMRMDFLNAAAHDIKTPLTPLKLQMASLRMRGNLDPKQKESLDLMDRNVNRFQVLVDDMLDAARLQAGKLKLKVAALALAPMVQEAVASFEEAAKQGQVTLEVTALPDVKVDADPSKAMQVLMNVVSNAVKYTPAGGTVRLRIDVKGNEAILAAQDTGLGMTAEQLGRLFQPFVRLHEGIAGVAKGTGLGLYISKGIVEQHGGRLWAESEGPSKGSTFYVAWPVAKTPAPAAA